MGLKDTYKKLEISGEILSRVFLALKKCTFYFQHADTYKQ